MGGGFLQALFTWNVEEKIEDSLGGGPYVEDDGRVECSRSQETGSAVENAYGSDGAEEEYACAYKDILGGRGANHARGGGGSWCR